MTLPDKPSSLPWVAWLSIAIAVCFKTLQFHLYYTPTGAMLDEMAGGINWTNGNGYALLEVVSSDLSQRFYNPIRSWPPLYSYVYGLLYLLSGKNIYGAALLAEALAWWLIIYYSRRLLRLWSTPAVYINIFTLLQGVFLYGFTVGNSTPDSLGIGFVLAGIFYVINSIHTSKDFSLVPAALFLSASAWTKYQFFPVAFAVPLLTWWYAIKNRLSTKPSITLLSIVYFFLSLLFLLPFLQNGKAFYFNNMHATVRGFYPEHISLFYPLFFSPFIEVETTCVQLEKIGLSYTVTFSLFRWLSIALLLGILVHFIRNAFSHKKVNLKEISEWFMSGIGLSLIGFLFLLSMITVEVYVDGSRWTYIQETRYYGLTDILLQLIVIGSLLFFLQQKKSTRSLFLMAISVSLLFGLHGSIFTLQKILQGRKPLEGQDTYVEAATFLDQYLLRKITDNVVVNSHEEGFMNVAAFRGVPGWYHARGVLDSSSANKEPVEIIFACARKNLPLYTPYLEKAGPAILFQNQDWILLREHRKTNKNQGKE